MKYTGSYTKREQAQRQAAIKRLIRAITSITSACTMERLLKIAIQMGHRDSGKASRAETLRDIISVWTMYHDDLDELEDMQKWVCYIATRRARQAQTPNELRANSEKSTAKRERSKRKQRFNCR
ncbi:MAG: hypothetical protein VZS12_08655 [Ruminococcus bromii]|nr:hypothetical protein [Ruminococcus bromii]